MRHDLYLFHRIGCGLLTIFMIRDYRNGTGSKIGRDGVRSHLRVCKPCRDSEKKVPKSMTRLRSHGKTKTKAEAKHKKR